MASSPDRLGIPAQQAVGDAGRSCDSSTQGVLACYTAGIAHVSLFLAKRIDDGLSVAVQQLGMACDHDVARACTWRGILLYNAIGVLEDNQRALIAFGRACDLRDHDGCTNLADMYLIGDLVKRNEETAYHYYKFGCEGNNAHACHMYGRQRAFENDQKGAIRYLQRACDNGNQRACVDGTIVEFHASSNGGATALNDMRHHCADATSARAAADRIWPVHHVVILDRHWLCRPQGRVSRSLFLGALASSCEPAAVAGDPLRIAGRDHGT